MGSKRKSVLLARKHALLAELERNNAKLKKASLKLPHPLSTVHECDESTILHLEWSGSRRYRASKDWIEFDDLNGPSNRLYARVTSMTILNDDLIMCGTDKEVMLLDSDLIVISTATASVLNCTDWKVRHSYHSDSNVFVIVDCSGSLYTINMSSFELLPVPCFTAAKYFIPRQPYLVTDDFFYDLVTCSSTSLPPLIGDLILIKKCPSHSFLLSFCIKSGLRLYSLADKQVNCLKHVEVSGAISRVICATQLWIVTPSELICIDLTSFEVLYRIKHSIGVARTVSLCSNNRIVTVCYDLKECHYLVS